jgi:ABC-2 type transport system permease protein
MRETILIAKRELAATFNSLWGYVVLAFILVVDGLLFNTQALGESAQTSTYVLEKFFEVCFGTTVVAAILLTMRLIAEERQRGTHLLLDASPVSDTQLVLGKFLSAFAFLTILTGATLYMPALIFVNGKVSLAHIGTGYLGLLLVGAAVLAIGTFGSAMGRNQLEAAAVSGFLVLVFLLMWKLGRMSSPPVSEVFSNMSLFDKHFQPFQRGRIEVAAVAYYLSICFVFLSLSVRRMSLRRWQ